MRFVHFCLLQLLRLARFGVLILSLGCGKRLLQPEMRVLVADSVSREGQNPKAATTSDTSIQDSLIRNSPIQDSLAQDTSSSQDTSSLNSQAKLPMLASFYPPQPKDFHTLSAKVAIDYSAKNTTIPPLTGHLRMLKDSIIWLSLYSFGIIEVFRIYLTPSNMQILDHLHSVAQVRSPAFLERFLHIPFDFATLQAYLLGVGGRQEFLQASLETPNSHSGFSTLGDYPHYQIYNDYSLDSLLLSSRFQARSGQQAQIFFTDFQLQSEPHLQFSRTRRVLISGSDSAELKLNFKDLKWNQVLKFPFSIPPRYKIYRDF